MVKVEPGGGSHLCLEEIPQLANPSCSTLPELPGRGSLHANHSGPCSTPPEPPGGGSSIANPSSSTLPELSGRGLSTHKIGRRKLWANRRRARAKKSIATNDSLLHEIWVLSLSQFSPIALATLFFTLWTSMAPAVLLLTLRIPSILCQWLHHLLGVFFLFVSMIL